MSVIESNILKGDYCGEGWGRKGKKVFWAADQNAMYFYSNERGVGGWWWLGALGAVVRGQRE